MLNAERGNAERRTLTWLHNACLDRVLYWLGRGELPGYVFRKGYMGLWYNTERVYVSAPQPGVFSARALLARGIVGLYGERWADMRGGVMQYKVVTKQIGEHLMNGLEWVPTTQDKTLIEQLAIVLSCDQEVLTCAVARRSTMALD